MSTTRTLQRRRPAAHAHRHPQTTPTTAPISPADVEAALLDTYPDLVRLAFANLPAKQPRRHRVLAAHAVVQHALQGHDLHDVADPKSFVRDRVQEASIRQAQSRTPVGRLPQVWALQLLSRTDPADEAFDPCSLKPACPTELRRCNTRAANLVIVVTTLLALGILTSLLFSN